MRTTIIQATLALLVSLGFAACMVGEDTELLDPIEGGDPTISIAARPPTTSTPGACSLLLPEATGGEADGLIPVCCTPASSETKALDDLARLINQYRQSNGLDMLVRDAS